MARSSSLPLLFEVLPPPRTQSPPWEDYLRRFDGLAGCGLAGVVVPEVDDGEYATVDPRGFAIELQRRLGVPAIVNRVTVHHAEDDLVHWARQTRSLGVGGILLVGGPSGSSTRPRTGASVEAALRALGPGCGVVTIPTRRRPELDEPERVLNKAAAGAEFAVSQVILEAGHARALVADLAAAALRTGQAAPRIHWSLAPITRPRDLAFLAGLGVHVPDAVRETFTRLPPSAWEQASHALNLRLAEEVLASCRDQGVPAGLCVSHVTLANIGPAIRLARALAAPASNQAQLLLA